MEKPPELLPSSYVLHPQESIRLRGFGLGYFVPPPLLQSNEIFLGECHQRGRVYRNLISFLGNELLIGKKHQQRFSDRWQDLAFQQTDLKR